MIDNAAKQIILPGDDSPIYVATEPAAVVDANMGVLFG